MRLVPVYKKGQLVAWAQVDDDRYDELIQWMWSLTADGHVYRHTKVEGNVGMHRHVLGLVPGDGLDGDHIDGDPLNNLSSNLRPVTRQLNIQNRRGANRGARSQYRGVCYCKQTKRWIATATVNRVCHWLGRHDTEEQAAAVAAEFRAKHMPGSREFLCESEDKEKAA